jgi:asparagine synthase (glutamine-hydrolysing)
MAREHVKVALSADGGDELFSGYSHYGIVSGPRARSRRLPRAARRRIGRAIQMAGPSRMQALAEALPLPGGPAPRRAPQRDRAPRQAARDASRLDRTLMYDLSMSVVDALGDLPLLGGYNAGREKIDQTDRLLRRPDGALRPALLHARRHPGQGRPHHHGLGASRGASPSSTIAWWSSRCACRWRCAAGALGTKHLVRRVLYKHVPRELLERPKQGFGIPLASWLRGELAPSSSSTCRRAASATRGSSTRSW